MLFPFSGYDRRERQTGFHRRGAGRAGLLRHGTLTSKQVRQVIAKAKPG
jgi:hypothetical protein